MGKDCRFVPSTESPGSILPLLASYPIVDGIQLQKGHHSFADQFANESYICDVWRIGLRLTPDESVIISRKQIKSKIEELLGDEF